MFVWPRPKFKHHHHHHHDYHLFQILFCLFGANINNYGPLEMKCPPPSHNDDDDVAITTMTMNKDNDDDDNDDEYQSINQSISVNNEKKQTMKSNET